MSISTTNARVNYLGDGVTVSFAVPFVFFASDELDVIERILATGVETTKALTTHYTVAGGNGLTGTVTAVVSPAAGVRWTLARRTKRTQLVVYTTNDPFPAKTHERALDRVTALVQELDDKLSRAAVLSVTTSITALTLPDPVADQVLGWKADLSGLENKVLVPAVSVVAASNANTRAGLSTAEFTTPRGVAALWRKGSDIVAAATVSKPADANLGGYHVVTGNVGVGALWAGEAAGCEIELRFAGTPILAHNGTSFILPAAANIQVAAGDVARFRCEGSDNWRCVQAPPSWYGTSSLGGNAAVAALTAVIGSALPPRGLVNGQADGFTDQTGVDAAGSTNEVYNAAGKYYTNISAPTTAYANAGGNGDRTASITVTISGYVQDAGTLNNLVDGASAANATDGIDMPITAVAGSTTRFDFGVKKYADELTLTQNVVQTAQFRIEGSNDTVSWDVLAAAGVILGSASSVVPLTNVDPGGYRYYQIVGVSGNYVSSFWTEVTFKINAGAVVAELDLRPNAMTAAVAPSTIGAVLLHQAVDAVTLNTDLVASVSRDGGATWTVATLIDRGGYDGTYKILTAIANVAGQPAGTSVKWRLVTANAKRQRIKGIATEWAA